MFDKTIDIISNSNRKRSRIVVNILKFIVTVMFTGVLYSMVWSDLNIHNLNSLLDALQFIFTVQSLRLILIFIGIWLFFYEGLMVLATHKMISISYIFSLLPKALFKAKSDEIPKSLKFYLELIVIIFIKLSFLKNENKELVPGNSFSKFKKMIKDWKNGKDDLGAEYMSESIILMMQIIPLIWFLEYSNGLKSILFCILVTIVLSVLSFCFLCWCSAWLSFKLNADIVYKDLKEYEQKHKKRKLLEQIEINDSTGEE